MSKRTAPISSSAPPSDADAGDNEATDGPVPLGPGRYELYVSCTGCAQSFGVDEVIKHHPTEGAYTAFYRREKSEKIFDEKDREKALGRPEIEPMYCPLCTTCAGKGTVDRGWDRPTHYMGEELQLIRWQYVSDHEKLTRAALVDLGHSPGINQRALVRGLIHDGDFIPRKGDWCDTNLPLQSYLFGKGMGPWAQTVPVSHPRKGGWGKKGEGKGSSSSTATAGTTKGPKTGSSSSVSKKSKK